ncbi:hypothetical protein RRG08_043574 [Elysia crispata]|uniref:Uncharacterized protein n=1 Tax=Elysia crispata TaxID=231223 RepID=A0AAE1A7I8_9GAST|nr:hypothetical protein RRG08_043574 [Elysia crispata]
MIPCSSCTVTFGSKSAFDKHIPCSGPPIDLTLVKAESTFDKPFQELATPDVGREWNQQIGKDCKINIKLIEDVEDKPSISSIENGFVIKKEEALSPSPSFGEEEREADGKLNVYPLFDTSAVSDKYEASRYSLPERVKITVEPSKELVHCDRGRGKGTRGQRNLRGSHSTRARGRKRRSKPKPPYRGFFADCNFQVPLLPRPTTVLSNKFVGTRDDRNSLSSPNTRECNETLQTQTLARAPLSYSGQQNMEMVSNTSRNSLPGANSNFLPIISQSQNIIQQFPTLNVNPCQIYSNQSPAFNSSAPFFSNLALNSLVPQGLMQGVLVGNQVLGLASSTGFSAGPICSSTKTEISTLPHSVGINSLSGLIGPTTVTTSTINNRFAIGSTNMWPGHLLGTAAQVVPERYQNDEKQSLLSEKALHHSLAERIRERDTNCSLQDRHKCLSSLSESQLATHANHVPEVQTSTTLLRGNTSQVLHTALTCSVAHCLNIPNEKVAQVKVNAMSEIPRCYSSNQKGNEQRTFQENRMRESAGAERYFSNTSSDNESTTSIDDVRSAYTNTFQTEHGSGAHDKAKSCKAKNIAKNKKGLPCKAREICRRKISEVDRRQLGKKAVIPCTSNSHAKAKKTSYENPIENTLFATSSQYHPSHVSVVPIESSPLTNNLSDLSNVLGIPSAINFSQAGSIGQAGTTVQASSPQFSPIEDYQNMGLQSMSGNLSALQQFSPVMLGDNFPQSTIVPLPSQVQIPGVKCVAHSCLPKVSSISTTASVNLEYGGKNHQAITNSPSLGGDSLIQRNVPTVVCDESHDDRLISITEGNTFVKGVASSLRTVMSDEKAISTNRSNLSPECKPRRKMKPSRRKTVQQLLNEFRVNAAKIRHRENNAQISQAISSNAGTELHASAPYLLPETILKRRRLKDFKKWREKFQSYRKIKPRTGNHVYACVQTLLPSLPKANSNLSATAGDSSNRIESATNAAFAPTMNVTGLNTVSSLAAAVTPPTKNVSSAVAELSTLPFNTSGSTTSSASSIIGRVAFLSVPRSASLDLSKTSKCVPKSSVSSGPITKETVPTMASTTSSKKLSLPTFTHLDMPVISAKCCVDQMHTTLPQGVMAKNSAANCSFTLTNSMPVKASHMIPTSLSSFYKPLTGLNQTSANKSKTSIRCAATAGVEKEKMSRTSDLPLSSLYDPSSGLLRESNALESDRFPKTDNTSRDSDIVTRTVSPTFVSPLGAKLNNRSIAENQVRCLQPLAQHDLTKLIQAGDSSALKKYTSPMGTDVANPEQIAFPVPLIKPNRKLRSQAPFVQATLATTELQSQLSSLGIPCSNTPMPPMTRIINLTGTAKSLPQSFNVRGESGSSQFSCQPSLSTNYLEPLGKHSFGLYELQSQPPVLATSLYSSGIVNTSVSQSFEARLPPASSRTPNLLPSPLVTKSTYLSGSRGMPSRPLINIPALLPTETRAMFTGAIDKTQTATCGSLVVHGLTTNTMSLIPKVSNEIGKQNPDVTSSFFQTPVVSTMASSMNSNSSVNGKGRGSSLTLSRRQNGCEPNKLISLKQNKHRHVNKKRCQNLYKSPFCRVARKSKGKVPSPSNLKLYSADTGTSEGKYERKSQRGTIGAQKKRLSIATKETFWSDFDCEKIDLRKMTFNGDPTLLTDALRPCCVLIPRLNLPTSESFRIHLCSHDGKDVLAKLDTFSSESDHEQSLANRITNRIRSTGHGSKIVITRNERKIKTCTRRRPAQQRRKYHNTKHFEVFWSLARKGKLSSSQTKRNVKIKGAENSNFTFTTHPAHSSDIKTDCAPDVACRNSMIESYPSELDGELEQRSPSYFRESQSSSDFEPTTEKSEIAADIENYTVSKVSQVKDMDMEELESCVLKRRELCRVSNIRMSKLKTAASETSSPGKDDKDFKSGGVAQNYTHNLLKQLDCQHGYKKVVIEPDYQIAQTDDLSVQTTESQPRAHQALGIQDGAEIYYSSESDSEILFEEAHRSQITTPQWKKAMVRRHREVTMFLVKHANCFTSMDDTEEYYCKICGKYKTNGLFKLCSHLKSHIVG